MAPSQVQVSAEKEGSPVTGGEAELSGDLLTPARSTASTDPTVVRRRGAPQRTVERSGFRRGLLVLGLVVFGVSTLLAGGHSYAIDNEVQFQTTRSLVHLRSDLEQVDPGWLARDDGPYRRSHDGGVVAIVPVGQSLLSVPFYVAGRIGAQLVAADQRDQFVRTATFFTNSLLLALAAVVVALIARELVDRPGAALLLGYVYALGTYALGNAQTYFTEIGTSLFVALACWLAIRAWIRHDHLLALGCGLSVGAAFLVRPSAALFVPLIGLCLVLTVWVRQRFRDALAAGALYSTGALAMMGVNALFAWWRFGDPADLGYEKVYQDNSLLSGLSGQAWSLGKGVIWYAPILLLSVLGAVLLFRRRTPEVVVLIGVGLANTFFYARVPFWSGDNSWGPRYALIVLPALVPLAIGVVRSSWGMRAIQVAGVVGLLVPGLPGTLVNFNTLYIQATRELGVGAETAAVRNQLEWQPLLNHLALIPEAVQDVAGVEQEEKVKRGPFSGDPNADYSYYGVEPRLDVWWAWIGPTRASGLTWVFLVPGFACLGTAAILVLRRRPESAGHRRRRRSGRAAPAPRHGRLLRGSSPR